MITRLAQKIPAAFSFAPELSRQESWGWLEELCASRTDLSTLCVLRADERLFLDFILGDRRFKSVAARVISAAKGDDGFYRAEIKFTDEVVKRELSQALLRILAATA